MKAPPTGVGGIIDNDGIDDHAVRVVTGSQE